MQNNGLMDTPEKDRGVSTNLKSSSLELCTVMSLHVYICRTEVYIQNMRLSSKCLATLYSRFTFVY